MSVLLHFRRSLADAGEIDRGESQSLAITKFGVESGPIGTAAPIGGVLLGADGG